MKTSTIAWIIAIVIIIVGGMWYFQSAANTSPSSLDTSQITSTPTEVTNEYSTPTPTAFGTTLPTVTPTTTSGALKSATITYTSSGFSPSTVTIAKGGTVTFVNQSNGSMWVASNPHPTHQAYSGTAKDQHCPDTAGIAFDQCATGDTYTFTFQKRLTALLPNFQVQSHWLTESSI